MVGAQPSEGHARLTCADVARVSCAEKVCDARACGLPFTLRAQRGATGVISRQWLLTGP